MFRIRHLCNQLIPLVGQHVLGRQSLKALRRSGGLKHSIPSKLIVRACMLTTAAASLCTSATASLSGASGKCAEPSWMSLLRAAVEEEKGDPTSRFVSLATIDNVPGKGVFPKVRTVAFRGFVDSPAPAGGKSSLSLPALTFATDLRSAKVSELGASSGRAEVMWYFKQTREQFRMRGSVDVVTAETTDPLRQKWRQDVWARSSPGSRASYSQGAPLSPAPDGGEPVFSPIKDTAEPCDNFGVLVLVPFEIDYLKLSRKPNALHERALHSLDTSLGEWGVDRVYP